MFNPDDSIHRYSRAQAVADGVLLDVSAPARQAGIHYPVALTRAAWERPDPVEAAVACFVRCGGANPRRRAKRTERQ